MKYSKCLIKWILKILQFLCIRTGTASRIFCLHLLNKDDRSLWSVECGFLGRPLRLLTDISQFRTLMPIFWCFQKFPYKNLKIGDMTSPNCFSSVVMQEKSFSFIYYFTFSLFFYTCSNQIGMLHYRPFYKCIFLHSMFF